MLRVGRVPADVAPREKRSQEDAAAATDIEREEDVQGEKSGRLKLDRTDERVRREHSHADRQDTCSSRRAGASNETGGERRCSSHDEEQHGVEQHGHPAAGDRRRKADGNRDEDEDCDGGDSEDPPHPNGPAARQIVWLGWRPVESGVETRGPESRGTEIGQTGGLRWRRWSVGVMPVVPGLPHFRPSWFTPPAAGRRRCPAPNVAIVASARGLVGHSRR